MTISTANSIATDIALQEKRRAASAAGHCDTVDNYQSPVGTSDYYRPFFGWIFLALLLAPAGVLLWAVIKWVVR